MKSISRARAAPLRHGADGINPAVDERRGFGWHTGSYPASSMNVNDASELMRHRDFLRAVEKEWLRFHTNPTLSDLRPDIRHPAFDVS